MLATAPQASQSAGTSFACQAALAARIATVKPFCGRPILPHSSALRTMTWMRW
jgi:hypothetical protein